MELTEFCRGISLNEEAVDALQHVSASGEQYLRMEQLFHSNRALFFSLVEKEKDAPLLFLYYYCRMALEVWEMYRQKGISPDIFWNTFSDFRLWCEDCRKKNGIWGLQEYRWLWRHLDLTLFGLGRLQFEKMPSEWEFYSNGKKTEKGQDVISIHIPAGKSLDQESCRDSFQKAFVFWGTEFPYVCHSWLLGEELEELLDETSNIRQFRGFFEIKIYDHQYREGEERIFGQLLDDPSEYPEKTSLQRRAKKLLCSGRRLGSGLGVLAFSENTQP